MKYPLPVLALVLVSTSCATATMTAKRDLVQQRAAFDLACNESSQVQNLGNNVFGATACGKHATYVVKCGDGSIESCTAVMNSDSKERELPPRGGGERHAHQSMHARTWYGRGLAGRAASLSFSLARTWYESQPGRGLGARTWYGSPVFPDVGRANVPAASPPTSFGRLVRHRPGSQLPTREGRAPSSACRRVAVTPRTTRGGRGRTLSPGRQLPLRQRPAF